jgi:hypothetical protein
MRSINTLLHKKSATHIPAAATDASPAVAAQDGSWQGVGVGEGLARADNKGNSRAKGTGPCGADADTRQWLWYKKGMKVFYRVVQCVLAPLDISPLVVALSRKSLLAWW